ncbi:MAG TPA: permease [Candidatus Ozemobacteraceae bacterium]|nr:permease [Candidatus Ozemobacteraceae bacterium]
MNWKEQWKTLVAMIAVFLGCYYLPIGTPRFDNAVLEALQLLKWYAREHVVLCLVPAFFIAGAITVFVSQAAVMKYLGPGANRLLAYTVASVSGTILAVCSCTILPLFNGIYRMGAGLGPAVTFLYSGPAINVLAIILTARILGFNLGLARAVGAVSMSIVIGLIMAWIFREEEQQKLAAAPVMAEEEGGRTLSQQMLFFASLVGILVFANFAKPVDETGVWHAIWQAKWLVASGFAGLLGFALWAWFGLEAWKVLVTAGGTVVAALAAPGEPMVPFVTGMTLLSVFTSTHRGDGAEWFNASWENAILIFPLLMGGVLVAGLLLGRPGNEGLIPNAWVAAAVGGNSIGANLFAAVFGAFMYFATLTEVPILQGLMGSGMGNGPALALLLAGPALSLPSMLVINGIMGFKKTFVFVLLVVVFSATAGVIYGSLA